MVPLLYAVGAGLVIAAGSVVEKLGLSTAQPYAGLFVRAGAVAGVLALSLVPFGRYADWGGLTTRAIGLLALGGVLAGLLAHFLYWQSLKATSPAYALPLMVGTSQAAVVLLSLGILKARVTPGQVAGVGLVILGIVLIQMLKAR